MSSSSSSEATRVWIAIVSDEESSESTSDVKGVALAFVAVVACAGLAVVFGETTVLLSSASSS